jgi:WD40 repeat protein/beta-lactamase regulating signal transducer with metallopeptidase domain
VLKEPTMSVLEAILANAACAAVLALPALLVSRYARRPALAHALWLLVLLKLATPPLVRPSLAWLPAPAVAPAPESARAAPAALPPDLPPAPLSVASGPAPAPAPPAVASRVEPPVVAALTEPPTRTPVEDPPTAEPPEEVPAAAETDSRGWLAFVGLLWLGGSVVCLGRAALYAVRFHRLLAHARPAPEELQAQARALAKEMGMKSCPPVWLVPGSLPPMVWGVGPVRVLFPAGLLDRLGRDERASLLVHELGHVARRDHWVRWLELGVLGVYWWYPLAWWARRQLQDREEECCDAWAANVVAARVYASAILEAVDFLAEARPRVPSVASPLAAAQSLKQRLTLILTDQPARRLAGPTRIALVALALGVLPLLPTLARYEQDKAQDRKEDKPAAREADEEVEPSEFSPAPANLVYADAGGARTDEIFSVSFSPDGKRIAAGSGNSSRPGDVEVYDVKGRNLVWRTSEERGVCSVCFSHDSRWLGWSGWGGFARVHDLKAGKSVYSLTLDAGYRVAFSADGRWLATAGENGGLKLWEAKAGRPVGLFRGDLPGFYSVCFSRDSKRLAVGGGRFDGGPANHALVFDVQSRKQLAKLDGHTRAVIGLAFAPHDAYVATASADNTVRVWDGKSYKLLHVLKGHTNAVKGVAFAPDGSFLATGSWDKTIRFWDHRTGKELARLDGHPAAVRELAFSPDGGVLASGGARRSLKLWDVKKKKQVATLRQDPAPPKDPTDPPGVSPIVFALSPDGKRVATGSESGAVVLLDAATGEVVHTLKGHEDAVTALAFSRDGKLLASGGPDTVIKLWDAGTGRELRKLRGHESWVYALAFTRDGKTLASGSYDRTVRLWDAHKPGKPRVLHGHKASVRSLSFTADGLTLASGGADKTVRIWDVKTLKSKAVLKSHAGAVRGVGFSPDGRTLASVGEDGFLYLYDAATLKERARVQAHPTEALSLAFSPGGRLVATGAQGGSIHFYDPDTAVTRSRRYAHNEGVLELAFGPGGRQLFSLGGDRSLKRWEPVVSPVRYLDGHKGPVNAVAVSADGRYALSCGSWPEGDKTLRLWDLKTGKAVRTFEGNKGVQLQSTTFSRDGRYALAGGTTGLIWQWEVKTGKLVREFRGHKDAVAHLVFSPDGKRLLSSSHDKTLRLWNFATGKTERTFTGHTDWARRAAFLPDGKRIVSGGRDRVLRLWDLENAKLLKTIDHHKQWVECIAVTADGRRCLTGGGNAMHLWDLGSGKELKTFEGHAFGVTGVALTRDQRTALSSSYDGSVRCWDVESGVEIQRYGGHRDWVWNVALVPDGKHFLSCGGGGQRGDAWVPGEDFTLRVWRLPRQVLARAR